MNIQLVHDVDKVRSCECGALNCTAKIILEEGESSLLEMITSLGRAELTNFNAPGITFLVSRKCHETDSLNPQAPIHETVLVKNERFVVVLCQTV